MTIGRPARGGSSGPRPRHDRGRRSGVLGLPRFGAVALAVAGVVGLAAGVGAGAAAERSGLVAALGAGSATSEADDASDLAAVEEDGAAAASSQPGTLQEPASGRGAQTRVGPTPSPVPPEPEAEPEPDPDAVDAAGLTVADREAGLLSTQAPPEASGELVVVPGSTEAPEPDRTVHTVRVEVEDGLDIDHELFARTVMDILNDPRGWGADGSLSFARTDGEARHRVVLASPATVDRMCAPLRTRGLYSCGRNGHAAINHMRWVQATDEFADRAVYREYLINHEVGHLLGHPHVDCTGPGDPAPIMQQQTIEVAPCEPNGWPFPDGG